MTVTQDYCGDADESDSVDMALTLVTTSCGQQRDIDHDDESSGSHSEGILGRMLNPGRLPMEGQVSHSQRHPGRVLDQEVLLLSS